MPRFPLPDGEDETPPGSSRRSAGPAQALARTGISHVRKQADYETGIIYQMSFPGYFLVVADFINWAKDQGIRVGPGRGSAAGSLAAYAMGITDLDPLAHGLIFERFLNPERVSMPDVDIDFDVVAAARSSATCRRSTARSGSARSSPTARSRPRPRSRTPPACSTRPYSVGDELTKLMPPGVMGKDIPLKGIFDPTHERYKEEPRSSGPGTSRTGAAEVIDQARDQGLGN